LKKKLLKKKKPLKSLKKKLMKWQLHTEEQERSPRNGSKNKEKKEKLNILLMNSGH
jgi:hypothetical protein